MIEETKVMPHEGFGSGWWNNNSSRDNLGNEIAPTLAAQSNVMNRANPAAPNNSNNRRSSVARNLEEAWALL